MAVISFNQPLRPRVSRQFHFRRQLQTLSLDDIGITPKVDRLVELSFSSTVNPP